MLAHLFEFNNWSVISKAAFFTFSFTSPGLKTVTRFSTNVSCWERHKNIPKRWFIHQDEREKFAKSASCFICIPFFNCPSLEMIIQPSTPSNSFQHIGIIVIIHARVQNSKNVFSSLAALCRVKLLPIDAEDICEGWVWCLTFQSLFVGVCVYMALIAQVAACKWHRENSTLRPTSAIPVGWKVVTGTM